MFQAFYIIQMLDNGEFLGEENGESVWYINMSKARTFQNLQNALSYARDIDHTLETVTVHTVYLPCNYTPTLL